MIAAEQTNNRRTLSRAERNIRWIEKNCRVPEGRDVGNPVVLREFQKEEIRRIYDNPAKTRHAIISFGRKNAKTALAAMILLLHLCGPEHRLNGQLYSTGQSREQAAIIFNLAAKMVRMSPDLSAVVTIRDASKILLCRGYGTVYRALSAEASTAYGLSPSLIIHDELGQVRGERSELYEAMETATGAQEDPLSVIISTQAPSASDLLSVLIDDALAGHDPKVVVSLYCANPDDDPFDVETIRKANPAFGDFLNPDEVLAMAEAARRMPSREAGFRNLVLNQRVDASSPFVTRSTWESCKGDVPDFDGCDVFGGLDLAEVNDLTAKVLVGKPKSAGGKWVVRPTFWLPREGLREKSRLDRVPYDLWSDQGHLEAVDGKSVDYDFVAAGIKKDLDRYNIKQIAFDRWNFKHLKPCLVRAGIDEETIEEVFVEFGQGFQSMSPAIRELETWLLNQKIVHGGHPVMNMCATSAVVKRDPAGNRKLDKLKSTQRIDGMVALVMAAGVASAAGESEKKREYQMLFV